MSHASPSTAGAEPALLVPNPHAAAALEPQWQREAAYADNAACAAAGAADMGEPVLYRHAGGTLGVRTLESTLWHQGLAVTGQGFPSTMWRLEASVECPMDPSDRQARVCAVVG